jgi:exocyst complex component 5
MLASLAKAGSEYLASAKDAYIERLDSSNMSPSQRSMLLRVAGLTSVDETKNKNDIKVDPIDGELSISNAKRMLKWLAEGVGRGMELSGGSETPKDVAAMLTLLLANMGEIYVETSLEAAGEAASSQENVKVDPDLSYLPSVRTATTITQLMLYVVNTVLMPLAASNLTVRRDMEKSTSQTSNRIEEKTSLVLQRTIDAVLAWVTKLLVAQKKSDFRPRDIDLEGDSGWLGMLQTPTCLSIFTFLTRFHVLAKQALDGKNLSAFLTEVGVGFRTLLLEHFKKFQVNAAGGIMVTKDITKYNELLGSWEVDAMFKESGLEVLQEIGNLFVIGPDALRERVKGMGTSGGALAGVEKEVLRAYILKREDAGSVAVQSVLSAL